MDRILTVTAPASSRDLTSLDHVKADLDITDSSSDAILASYISTASRAAARRCNEELIFEGVSERFRAFPHGDSASLANAPNFIYLRRTPIVSITSVIEDDKVLVGNVDYEIDIIRGAIIRIVNDFPFRWNFQKLTISYAGGYTFPGTLEDDIERAVILIVKNLYYSKLRDPLLRSEKLDNIGELTYFEASGPIIPEQASDLLAPYTRPIF